MCPITLRGTEPHQESAEPAHVTAVVPATNPRFFDNPTRSRRDVSNFPSDRVGDAKEDTLVVAYTQRQKDAPPNTRISSSTRGFDRTLNDSMMGHMRRRSAMMLPR